jgi:tryptophan-rich sensory protein
MKKKSLIFFSFLGLNFLALALGVFLMNNGPISNWYLDLKKAPWTPPGWAFGVAWTSIMFCFSVYMTKLVDQQPVKKVYTLFALQWVLNVLWNYLFFNQHFVFVAFFELLLLTFVIAYFLIQFSNTMKYYSFFVIPYFLWLLIASSLNGYIVLYNK